VTLEPLTPDSNGYFSIPDTYPAYYRLTAGNMTVTYGGVDYSGIYVKVLRSDLKAEVFLRNVYRKPKLDTHSISRSRIYIQLLQGKIRAFLPAGVSAKNLIIEYIKDPDDIFVDVNGTKSVDCELDDNRAAQVVEIAVTKYLEEIQNPRYQTAMAETQIDNLSN
jgi:hypothetical protein